jgi:Zn-dependent peptidase ImmA (M78 family)
MPDEEFNSYHEHGFENREEYLQDLSEQYNVPLEVVYETAELFGDNEDFDGLVNAMEDAEIMFAEE